MTDEQETERWRALAEELGLDDKPAVRPAAKAPREAIPEAARAEDDVFQSPDAPAGQPEEVEPASPKKRRGRRSGRRRKENGEKSASRDDEAAPQRGRNRRKGRRRKEEVTDETEMDDKKSAESPTDEEEDGTDNLSGWNVPTWTELIDSLYRPDR